MYSQYYLLSDLNADYLYHDIINFIFQNNKKLLILKPIPKHLKVDKSNTITQLVEFLVEPNIVPLLFVR